MSSRCKSCGKPRDDDYDWVDGCCDHACHLASQQTPKLKNYRDKSDTLYIYEKFRPTCVFNEPPEGESDDE